ncbi:LRR receptor-like serine/threonine-protein kinase ERL1 [Chenopodium quinoa]|uniref:LRR receptor-like serine/threonine-protein kinase ERL1 n=1 Tax=Chenopodium quinoa TaxID=63459 RepID=UPI000B7950D1|nr:LRR receptor-like serine/threonine-protein kinase ERL1 [Chenopodium quinoa]
MGNPVPVELSSSSVLLGLLALSSLFYNAASTTYWRDILVLKQLKLGIDPDSVSPGSCISSWDFSHDPCDTLFSDKFTCGFTCDTLPFPSQVSRVTEIALDQATYSGTISSISWNLPLLRSLDLSGNNFSGPIPASLSNLTRLTRLILSTNSLSGPIPDSLSRLTHLQDLLLDANALTGPIPPSFSELLNLKRLDIQGNQLTGELPDLSPLTSLNSLDCSHNSFSGQLPPNLPPSLLEISMRNNNLGGPLPLKIGKLPFLQVLDLSYNQLSGSVPPSFFTHPSLQQLSLSYNNLTSVEVPTGLGTQSGLIAIDLSNNHLTGLLPGFMGLMPKLSALSLENNTFMGMIPTQYAFKAVWPQPRIAPFQRLLLGGNFIYGPIPDPLMKLHPGSSLISLVNNCLLVCPNTLFFCQGANQKSLLDCRNNIGPVIP